MEDIEGTICVVIRNNTLKIVPYLEILNKYSRLNGLDMTTAHSHLISWGWNPHGKEDDKKQARGLLIGDDVLLPFILFDEVKSIINMHAATEY